MNSEFLCGHIGIIYLFLEARSRVLRSEKFALKQLLSCLRNDLQDRVNKSPTRNNKKQSEWPAAQHAPTLRLKQMKGTKTSAMKF